MAAVPCEAGSDAGLLADMERVARQLGDDVLAAGFEAHATESLEIADETFDAVVQLWPKEQPMSSTHHILCMSHDPAIIVSGDGWNNAAEAIERAGDPGRFADMAEHKDCDLLVGRYSYPLVEVGCPPRENSASGCMHVHAQWIRVEWVRLLAASLDSESAPLGAAVEELTRHHRCWSRERIQRLRSEL